MLRDLLIRYKSPLILLVFITVLLIVGFILRSTSYYNSPELTPAPPVIREDDEEQTHLMNTWNNITPGVSNINEDLYLGEFLLTIEYSDVYNKSTYSYGGIARPVEIYFHKDIGRIDRVVVPSIDTYNNHLQELVSENNLGMPDIEFYVGEFEQKLYVFLDEGIAFNAGETSGGVFETFYFTPTTRENFIELWGQSLTLEPEFHGH